MRLVPLIACAIAGATAATLPAQTAVAPAIADMSNYVPIAGRWTFTPIAGGGEARFLDNGNRAQLTITCVRGSRSVAIAKPASAASPYLQVWSTSDSRNLPASFNPATNLLTATVPAGDKLLDGLAQSRGRIAVGIVGQQMLVAPAWPEIGRVVEECRI